MDTPICSLGCARQTDEQCASIIVVHDDASTGVASGYDVLKRSRDVDAWLARHRTSVADRSPEYQMSVTASSWRRPQP